MKKNFTLIAAAAAFAAALPLYASAPSCAAPAQNSGKTAAQASKPAQAATPGRTAQNAKSEQAAALKYPDARRTDFSETIHGVNVADPYRWMENIDSAETQAWIAAERKTTSEYMQTVPSRDKIRSFLDRLQNYPRTGRPAVEGGKYFYRRNSGLQNQDVLCMSDSPDAEGRVILDPNTLSANGTAALTGWCVSDDASSLAYSIASSGSDWNQIKVIDLKSGKTLPDTIDWVKFSNIAWDKSGEGFFYSRYPAPAADSERLSGVNSRHTLCYHKLGTAQSSDKTVLANPDNADLSVYGSVSEDYKWLIVEVSHSADDNTAILVKDLTNPEAEFVTLPNAFAGKFSPVTVQNGTLIAFTDWQAPKGRAVSIKLASNVIDKPWTEIIPESEDALSSLTFGGGSLFATFMHDAADKVVQYSMEGRVIRNVELPGIGSVGGFDGKTNDQTVYYTYTSFNTPNMVYAYDTASGKSTAWHHPKLSFNPNDFVTKEVFVSSTDGAKVPLFITHRKDVKINGDVPALLYGYGGFAINMGPYFSTRAITWMQMGGVYAQACLRGGAEYGEAWHKAGTKTQKQHVFDDFINCAEWLISNNYTNTKRLAINGGSNGGLLVGACLNQRPDLFAAAVPQVGVMDMLRFHKFTIGRYWTGDYGDVGKKSEFEALYRISPCHNVKKGTAYPPTLITTGDHDDRVYPAHSFKYAAEMQYAQGGDAPILIRIDSDAGHGAGKPISKSFDETADILSFIAKAVGMTDINLK